METSLKLPEFGRIEPGRLVNEDSAFAVIWDKYPVSPGHCLIVAKRRVPRFGQLRAEETERLPFWINWCIRHLQTTLQPAPDGFNIGLNDGPSAGQTVHQFHVHVIPRYRGDVEDPQGGVRWVIPRKAKYLTVAESPMSAVRERRFRAAMLAEHVMAAVPYFAGLTETKKSTISNRSTMLFTLTGIRNATQSLLAGLNTTSDDESIRLAVDFWTEVGRHIREWQMAKDHEVSPADLRRGFVHSHTLALAAIARAGNELLSEQPDTWHDTLNRLETLDWRRSNTKLWEGRAMNAGRISKHNVNVTLTANVVKRHLGLALSAQEKRIEREFLQSRKR